MWQFPIGHRFQSDEIDVLITGHLPEDSHKGWKPAYQCDVVFSGGTTKVGELNLRIGYSDSLVRYGGHIGYSILPAHRGHSFASKACKLILPVFEAHGMDVIWITCNPDNWASRKTAERIGCELVDIVALPEWIDMYQEGERMKCRYRCIIYPTPT